AARDQTLVPVGIAAEEDESGPAFGPMPRRGRRTNQNFRCQRPDCGETQRMISRQAQFDVWRSAFGVRRSVFASSLFTRRWTLDVELGRCPLLRSALEVRRLI